MKRYVYALVLMTFLLGGCSNGNPVAPGDSAAKMELRVYQVPPEHTQDLLKALTVSFSSGGIATTIGTVSSPAPGQLIVLAPASLQGSIADTLKSLRDSTKPAAPTSSPEQIRLQFWSVDALAGAGTDDPALSELKNALDETRKSLGDVHFVLLDHVSSVSGIRDGASKQWQTELDGPNHALTKQLEYWFKTKTDGQSLGFEYAESAGSYVTSVKTTVPMRNGQVLVLSQSPSSLSVVDHKQTTPAATRLYIVRADPVPAA